VRDRANDLRWTAAAAAATSTSAAAIFAAAIALRLAAALWFGAYAALPHKDSAQEYHKASNQPPAFPHLRAWSTGRAT